MISVGFDSFQAKARCAFLPTVLSVLYKSGPTSGQTQSLPNGIATSGNQTPRQEKRTGSSSRAWIWLKEGQRPSAKLRATFDLVPFVISHRKYRKGVTVGVPRISPPHMIHPPSTDDVVPLLDHQRILPKGSHRCSPTLLHLFLIAFQYIRHRSVIP